MRAAAFAAVICASALAAGCGSKSPPGLEHPHLLKGSIEEPDQKRLGIENGVSVDFISDDRGFLATESGVILRTIDGGLTWSPLAGHVLEVTQIDFVSASRGFALSGRNTLLGTNDAGRSWHRVRRFSIGTREAGTALDFVDSDDGWVVPSGGPLYRTRDGGESWTALRLPCNEYDSAVGPSFFGPEQGYVVCAGQPSGGWQRKSLYATDDAGGTWELADDDWASEAGYARRLSFRGPDDGLFVTYKGGLSRMDAGGSSRNILFIYDEDWVEDVAWPSAQRIYLITGHAGLLRTDDGGEHWRRLYGGANPPPSGRTTFSSATEGIGFGAAGFVGGSKAVFSTKDAGRTWSRLSLDPPHPLADQVFRFGNTIIAANGGGLTRSDDGGRHWSKLLALPASRSARFSFVSPDVGYRAEGKRLYRTGDGGSTWKLSARAPLDLYGVAFMTSKRAFVVDYGDPPPDDGKKHTAPLVDELLESNDGGEHWQAVDAPQMGTVFAMHRFDEQHWWLFATVSCPRVRDLCGGQIWRTSDGGSNWDLIELPRPLYAESFSFVSPKVGFAGSPGSGLWRTDDGGVSWSFVYPG